MLTLEVRLDYLRSDDCKPFNNYKMAAQALGVFITTCE